MSCAKCGTVTDGIVREMKRGAWGARLVLTLSGRVPPLRGEEKAGRPAHEKQQSNTCASGLRVTLLSPNNLYAAGGD